MLTIRKNLLDELMDFEPFTKDFFGGQIPKKETNFTENEDHYLYEIILAGVSKDDIKIEVEDGYLKIISENEKKEENSWYYESFRKQMRLSDDINQDEINCKMEDGILSINLPKREKISNKKLIEVS